MACWSCQRPEGEGALCEKCGAIQPPRPRTHFEVMGVAARFDLGADDLESRYKELSRRLHPDRFARAETRARMYSLQHATALNDAYRTLRDPARRAAYLLRLRGIEIDSDRTTDGVRTVKAEPDLLAEMMELQEALADAKTDGRGEDVARMADDMRRRREQDLSRIANEYAAASGGSLERIAQLLVALRYYDRFLAEAGAKEHAA